MTYDVTSFLRPLDHWPERVHQVTSYYQRKCTENNLEQARYTQLPPPDTVTSLEEKTSTVFQELLVTSALASGQTGAPFFVTSLGDYTLRKKCFHQI